MKNISITQAIMLIVAGFAIIIAVFIFAIYRGKGSTQELGQVEMWGTLSRETFDELFRDDEYGKGEDYSNITYVEKTPENFEKELVGSLAEGNGPDLVLLRENQIIENENRLLKTPYSNLDLRTFQETFIEEADILLSDEGYIGFPFLVDPLVMYYNKDILNSNGIAKAPDTWTEILSVAPELTVSDSSFNISKSAIALGQFDNVKNAKEIIWTLILQSGSDVIVRLKDINTTDTKGYMSKLTQNQNYSSPPSSAAINFYTQFTNPSKTVYSWNRSLPNSEDFFLAGDSAFYLGFASELPTLRIKNPNLNFDVKELPQSKNATKKTTYGKMYFIGITRNTKDIKSAYGSMLKLTNVATQEKLSKVSGLPSVRRELIANSKPDNSFEVVFNKSALFARGVLEPNANTTNLIISKMIGSIVSGELQVPAAISKAESQIIQELKN